MSSTSAEQDRPELQKAMEEMVESGFTGVTMRVHDERGEWNGNAGRRKPACTQPVRRGAGGGSSNAPSPGCTASDACASAGNDAMTSTKPSSASPSA
jgi:hypothetical protein